MMFNNTCIISINTQKHRAGWPSSLYWNKIRNSVVCNQSSTEGCVRSVRQKCSCFAISCWCIVGRVLIGLGMNLHHFILHTPYRYTQLQWYYFIVLHTVVYQKTFYYYFSIGKTLPNNNNIIIIHCIIITLLDVVVFIDDIINFFFK